VPADVQAKLRRFVEGGGTLWVENCGRFTFAPAPSGGSGQSASFFYDLQFNSGGNSGAGAFVASPNHPLLSQPFNIRPEQIQGLGDKAVNDYYIYSPFNSSSLTYDTPPPGANNANPPGKEGLVPIVWNTRGIAPIVFGSAPNRYAKPSPDWRPYIMAGQIGAGKLVLSSQDSGCAINDHVVGVNASYGGIRG